MVDAFKKWLVALLHDPKRLLRLTVVLGVLLRLAAAFALGDTAQVLPGIFDQVSYDALATRIAHGYGFTFAQNWWPLTRAGEPTAHWSYLYTLYLTVQYYFFGAHPLIPRLIQALIGGIFTPLLTYRIGKRAFGENVGLIAAVWTAFYGYFIYYAAAIMTETFFILGVLWTFDVCLRITEESEVQSRRASWPRWLELGLAIGVSVLLRQVFLLFVAFLLLWMLWVYLGKLRLGHALSGLLPGWALTLLVLVAMILPFTIFNYQRFHRFVLLNTNSGYAFFWANHPIYGTHFEPILPSGTYQELIPEELRGLDEAALDAALLRRGFQFVFEDPGRYLLLSLSRFPAYFIFWPLSTSSLPSNITRVGSFGLALPFMLLGIIVWLVKSREIGWAAAFRTPPGLLLSFILIYSLIHLLSWALIRYRLPVDAVALVFAGYGLQFVWQKLVQPRLTSLSSV